MTDFCITKVKYSDNKEHIQWVIVREELVSTIGEERVVPRAFVADLIRKGKATFQTRVWDTSNKHWASGAMVHVIDDEFLSTDRNSRKRDNLGSLPTF